MTARRSTFFFNGINAAILAVGLGLVGATAIAAPISVEMFIDIEEMYEARFVRTGRTRFGEWETTVVDTSTFLPGSTLTRSNGLRLTFSYDPTTPLGVTAGEGSHAIYTNALADLTLSSDGFSLSGALPQSVSRSSLGVVNDYFTNGTDSLSFYQSFNSREWFASTFIEFSDASGQLLSGLDIPTALNLEQFSKSYARFGLVNKRTRDQFQLIGTVSFAQPVQVQVPGPGTLFLLLAGLLLTVTYRLRLVFKRPEAALQADSLNRPRPL